MDQLFNQLQSYYQLSPAVKQALEENFEQVVLSKNEFLIREGQICRYLYFLEKGAIRNFCVKDGKEITEWFAFENDFVTSFNSFTTQVPATEFIQLIEGSVLWSISKDAVSRLYNEHQDIERLARIAYEKYYRRLEERLSNTLYKSAAERYEDLLSNQPHILERVSLGQVASYLGISQETLSRIRNRIQSRD